MNIHLCQYPKNANFWLILGSSIASILNSEVFFIVRAYEDHIIYSPDRLIKWFNIYDKIIHEKCVHFVQKKAETNRNCCPPLKKLKGIP